MDKLEISFEVRTKNLDLMHRLDSLCIELDISKDEVFEIAVDRLLQDFNEIIHLWTCRKAIAKRAFVKPKAGDIF